MKSKLLTIIVGVIAMAAAFFATLWLTETPAEMLAKHIMPDEASIRAAAKLEGFSESSDIKANIEGVTRKNASTATVSGWAADLRRMRVTVLGLVDGKDVMIAQTSGPRPDVAKYLQLPADSAGDMQFKSDFMCSRAATLHLVLVSEDKRFGLGPSITCP